jgi:hypothetical protein
MKNIETKTDAKIGQKIIFMTEQFEGIGKITNQLMQKDAENFSKLSSSIQRVEG